MTRKYQHSQGLLPQIKAMPESGMPQKEVENGEQTIAGFSLAHRKEVRPKFKYQATYQHRAAYSVSVMCRFFGVSRSGYYDYVKRAGQPEKDSLPAEKFKAQQEQCFQTYGYRRMQLWLESQGVHNNPKT